MLFPQAESGLSKGYSFKLPQRRLKVAQPRRISAATEAVDSRQNYLLSFSEDVFQGSYPRAPNLCHPVSKSRGLGIAANL